ncbi:MAG: DHH family phosphoesterase [Perlucidibaca sp.]
MAAYDVFNGDADGLCALVQLRLAEPREATLITGVKRDIQLLAQVPVQPPARVTVLDINLDQNRQALDALLAADHDVFYADHHYPGESLPAHPAFSGHIDTAAETCTSLIVDRLLCGRYALWATVAAFGDNLVAVAEARCRAAGLTEAETAQLRLLGTCLNYNGYGAGTADLHFHPAELFRALQPYASPFSFMHDNADVWRRLSVGYADDMRQGLEVPPLASDEHMAVIVMPDAAWSRRVNGVLGNELANRHPGRAHALVTTTPKGDYAVSIRAPLRNRQGADALARQFATGGGRQAAAGINHLPVEQLPVFIEAMAAQWR